jgi:hypothetical protein
LYFQVLGITVLQPPITPVFSASFAESGSIDLQT